MTYNELVERIARARITVFGGNPDEIITRYGKSMPAWHVEQHAAEQFIACMRAYEGRDA